MRVSPREVAAPERCAQTLLGDDPEGGEAGKAACGRGMRKVEGGGRARGRRRAVAQAAAAARPQRELAECARVPGAGAPGPRGVDESGATKDDAQNRKNFAIKLTALRSQEARRECIDKQQGALEATVEQVSRCGTNCLGCTTRRRSM